MPENELRFEWDEGKASSNLAKHGVSFEEASKVFDDPDARFDYDETHSVEEDRWRVLGSTPNGRMLLVVYTERPGVYRIISARHATSAESRTY